MSKEILISLKREYGDLVFGTIIPSSNDFQKAIENITPICSIGNSPGCKAFKNFSEELLIRI